MSQENCKMLKKKIGKCQCGDEWNNFLKKTQKRILKKTNWKNWDQEERRWGRRIEKENEEEKGW